MVERPLYGAAGRTLRLRETIVGWTAGGGVEYALTDNVVGRVDYRYEDFGKKRGVKLTDNRLMVGIAYKF